MEKIYGSITFKRIWEPILEAKFGKTLNQIPLRWISGRLKQRIESRSKGREKLGYLKGSLNILIDSIEKFILSNEGSEILKSFALESIESIEKNSLIKSRLKSLNNNYDKFLNVDKVIFTTPTNIANKILKRNNDKIFWGIHKYFVAYCVLIELSESLSNYYWNNIVDKDVFFCGYIEQTRLTGVNEYGGIYIGYLTKYVDIRNHKILSKDQILNLTYETLETLFPKKGVKEKIIKVHISIAKYAQPITDFSFKPVQSFLHADKNLFITNMTNFYPKERSINNAIEIGEKVIDQIYAKKVLIL